MNIKEKIVTGYALRFDVPDSNNVIIKKEAVDVSSFEKMKNNKEILYYEVDDIGVKVTKTVFVDHQDTFEYMRQTQLAMLKKNSELFDIELTPSKKWWQFWK